MVALLHPEWDRSCATCEKYLPKDDGTLLLNRSTGEPLRRTREPTPCHKCPKVPLAVRTSGADPRKMRQFACDLTTQDRKTWAFYRKCRSVGRFPDDALVDWYSSALTDVYDTVERLPTMRMVEGIEALVKHLVLKGR